VTSVSKKKSTAAAHARQRAAAERAAKMRAQQQKQERRRRLAVYAGVVVVAVALIALIVWAVTGDDKPTTPPDGATDTYGLAYGDPEAPVRVEIYEDFLCPACGALEAEMGTELTEAADAGRAYVTYRPVAILDRSSRMDYPTRAANAVAVVLDAAGPEAAKALHDLLYERQPTEGRSEPDDDELIAWAVEAGASESAVRPGIEDRAFEGWVDAATDAMADNGYESTPSVVVDGERIEGQPIADVADQLRARLGS